MGSNCVPCVEYHIRMRKVGLTDLESTRRSSMRIRSVKSGSKDVASRIETMSSSSEEVQNAAAGEACGCGDVTEAAK